MPPWAIRLMTTLNIGMFRLLGGVMRIQGRPLLLLTTVGGKTGKKRETPLAWFPDSWGGRWLIVGSGAGSARHPAWFLNLARNPGEVCIQFGGRTYHVRPRLLAAKERDEAWAMVVRMGPGYRPYQSKTDRQIPLVSLTAIE
jgi:deazaflavin-dependent oxidoreductase (nitroreductase family)